MRDRPFSRVFSYWYPQQKTSTKMHLGRFLRTGRRERMLFFFFFFFVSSFRQRELCLNARKALFTSSIVLVPAGNDKSNRKKEFLAIFVNVNISPTATSIRIIVCLAITVHEHPRFTNCFKCTKSTTHRLILCRSRMIPLRTVPFKISFKF